MTESANQISLNLLKIKKNPLLLSVNVFFKWLISAALRSHVVFIEFYYLPSSCCSSSDPRHHRGNGSGGPEGDALSKRRSSSVVPDEDCRVSGRLRHSHRRFCSSFYH